MKMTFEDLVTDIFFLSFFSSLSFSFLPVILFFAFLLCNIERMGLDLAGGG